MRNVIKGLLIPPGKLWLFLARYLNNFGPCFNPPLVTYSLAHEARALTNAVYGKIHPHAKFLVLGLGEAVEHAVNHCRTGESQR
jgi:hypothetical protein